MQYFLLAFAQCTVRDFSSISVNSLAVKPGGKPSSEQMAEEHRGNGNKLLAVVVFSEGIR